ncbi:MAG: succinate dehydrogenase, hydrophobic membrane anchor protein [Gammaproteobacteria bacterium]|nr:succinate dehydrogenase, hydrophobic membrane anchor protein [Gammaproteobacteria bacterium]
MSRQASGLKAWALQRITAVYLGLFLIYAISYLLFNPPADVNEWRAWVGSPYTGVGLLLFFVTILVHAWVGVRDFFIDYVHPIVPRVALLTFTGFALVGSGLWVAKVIFLAGAGN